MKDFGLVVIGAHSGIWLKDLINKYSNHSILLVEPVPYNLKILKEKYSSNKNINICTNAIFSKNKIESFYFVKKDSIEVNSKNLKFIVTDFKNEIIVSYDGAVPNLFEEEKGVVAEGYLQDRKFLKADKILAKHDENYMPPEVKEAISDN